MTRCLLVCFASFLLACGGGGPPDNLAACGETGAVYTEADFPPTPGCERLLGSLDFSGSDVMDFTFLSSLMAVDGFVRVQNARFVTGFVGMDGIERVGGELTIANTPTIDLSGLGGLQTVGGDLTIASNQRLRSVDGLGELMSVGGDLLITGNTELVSVSGLSALRRVDGDLHLYDSPMVPTAEADALLAHVSVGGRVVRVRP
jgi:hypothetical protein